MAALVLCLAVAAAAGCARGSKSAPSAPSDKEAHAAAGRLVSALGGAGRLDRIRYLRFEISFQDEGARLTKRAYWLDRRKGLVRLEGTRGRTGAPFLALLDLNTKQGKVFTGYHYANSDDPAILREAFADYEADTDWLLGVRRLAEPGAPLKHLGTQDFARQPSPTLERALADPPGGRRLYHLSADGKSVIGSTTIAGRAPSSYIWTQWRPLRKFKFPVRFERVSGGGPREIRISNVFAPKTIEAEIFTRP